MKLSQLIEEMMGYRTWQFRILPIDLFRRYNFLNRHMIRSSDWSRTLHPRNKWMNRSTYILYSSMKFPIWHFNGKSMQQVNVQGLEGEPFYRQPTVDSFVNISVTQLQLGTRTALQASTSRLFSFNWLIYFVSSPLL